MAKLLNSVKGLRVLVTGGGSGLGHATVKRMVEQGAKVVAVDLSGKENLPKAASFVQADVTSDEQLAEAFAQAEKSFGGLDVAVSCAGIGIAVRTYNWNKDSMHSSQDFLKVLQVNAMGTFNVARLAARLMAKNAPDQDGGRGVIINTASIAAYDGQIGQVAYAASKGAIVSMTLPLARDLSPIGIRVCSIAPGYFTSPMTYRDNFPARVVKFLSDHNRAIYRLGRPAEFAELVQNIIINKQLNGTTIRIDAASRAFYFNRKGTAQPVVAGSDDAKQQQQHKAAD